MFQRRVANRKCRGSLVKASKTASLPPISPHSAINNKQQMANLLHENTGNLSGLQKCKALYRVMRNKDFFIRDELSSFKRNTKSFELEFNRFQYTRFSLKTENKVDLLHVVYNEINVGRPRLSRWHLSACVSVTSIILKQSRIILFFL